MTMSSDKNNLIRFSVFGSCISRDAVEFNTDSSIVLASYIARESVFSVLADSISVKDVELQNPSPFCRRMVLHDLRKDVFEVLRTDSSSYLILDFIDERFNVVKFRGSIATASKDFLDSGLLGGDKPQVVNKDLSESNMAKVASFFCNRARDFPAQQLAVSR